jgi:hypothetical protein
MLDPGLRVRDTNTRYYASGEGSVIVKLDGILSVFMSSFLLEMFNTRLKSLLLSTLIFKNIEHFFQDLFVPGKPLHFLNRRKLASRLQLGILGISKLAGPLMSYIKPENLIFHNDALVTLEVLRQHTLESHGDDSTRQRILQKIDARIEELNASVFEREEPSGEVRVRHPSIGVMCINHELLPEPTQLFASHIKSLVAFTITISRADALVGKDGLIRYEPYEVIAQFKMTESAFSALISSPGSGQMPATIESVKHYRIDPYFPDVLANSKTLVSRSLENCLDGTQTWLDELANLISDAAQKGAKPSLKAAEEITKYASMVEGSVVSNPAYGLLKLAEFAEVVKAHSQQEVEALIAFHQMKQGAK